MMETGCWEDQKIQDEPEKNIAIFLQHTNHCHRICPRLQPEFFFPADCIWGSESHKYSRKKNTA